MDLNWSLSELYPSLEGDDFKRDIEKLDTSINEINKWVEEVIKDKNDILNKLEEYIKRYSHFKALSYSLQIYLELSLSVNTKDELALKYSDILQNMMTGIVKASTKMERWINTIENIDNYINGSEVLKEHEFFLKEIIKKGKYLLSDNEEEIISKMKNTGSNAWLKLKDNLISNLTVSIDSKEYPLTVVLNMAYDKDKEVRKKAYEAEILSYKKVEAGVAAALNGIKGEVITTCNLRGYESPLEETLIDSRLNKKALDTMLEAIEESLPHFRRYLKKKAKMLGYEGGLPFYEMYAPVSEANMKFTYEEAAKYIEKNFRTFSNNLGEFAKRAINNNWVDVMPKEGKVSGAFCENINSIGESRILLNFGGNFSDVVTLAHELGHGFHGECLKDEAILNSDYPMPIAETASTFCETIIKNAALKDASREEALAILETEISDCTQVVVDIYSRFLFEKWFFEERQESALSTERIKELMIKAQRQAYGDGLDENYLHPYMWTWKPHYYYANTNFYNFPYAFGLLFAKGLYAMYLEKGEKFTKEYEKLLSLTGKEDLETIGNTMGIDIYSKDFWRSSLEIVIKDINKFLNL